MKAKVWWLLNEDAGDGAFRIEPEVRVLEVVAREFGHDLTCEPLSVQDGCRRVRTVPLDPPQAALVAQGVNRRQLGPFQDQWSLDVQAWALNLKGASLLRGFQDLLVVSDAPSGMERKGISGFPGSAQAQRVFRASCQLAQQRWGLLTEVEGLSFLSDGVLAQEQEFPAVSVRREALAMAAQRLSRGSPQYDVVMGGHTFAEWLVGGLVPEAAEVSTVALLGEASFGLYQPAGRDLYCSILTAAMLLRHSLGLGREAAAVEDAVRQTRIANKDIPFDVLRAVLGFLSNDVFYSRAV